MIYLCGNSLLIVFTGRNLLGGVFPLVTNAMFTNLGYPGASSLLGGIVSQRTYFPLAGSILLILTGVAFDARTVGTSALRTKYSCKKQTSKCTYSPTAL